ncbi:MAG: hypothetical protein QXW80_04460 [Candidatus Micrarchaeia archaeon]
MSFRLLAYSMIDRYVAYLSPSEVYKILKKYDLITPWERPERLDERWQTNIICMKVKDRFLYFIILFDDCTLVHHSLMTSMELQFSESRSTESDRESQEGFSVFPCDTVG